VIEGELDLMANPLALATVVPEPDDVVTVYDATGSTPTKLNSLKCPFERGIREILVSYGERSDRRGVFHECSPTVEYNISLDWTPDYGKIVDAVEDIEDTLPPDRIEIIGCPRGGDGPYPEFAGSASGPGLDFTDHDAPGRGPGDPSGDRFPHCKGDIEIGHGPPDGPRPRCPPPSPLPVQGTSFHAFKWKDEADLDVRVRSDEGLEYRVRNSQGEPVGQSIKVTDRAVSPVTSSPVDGDELKSEIAPEEGNTDLRGPGSQIESFPEDPSWPATQFAEHGVDERPPVDEEHREPADRTEAAESLPRQPDIARPDDRARGRAARRSVTEPRHVPARDRG